MVPNAVFSISMAKILVPSQVTLLPCRLGVDQHSRIEQALRIQCCFGRPEGSGEQRRALAIVPPPVVAPDRMMVGDRAAICDHGIKTGRLDSVPLRAQLAMPSGGVEGEVWRRPVRIDMVQRQVTWPTRPVASTM